MTGLTRKRWYFFIWDEHNEEHLGLHRIQHWEAEEVFFNKYVITPNKKHHGPERYMIVGRTNAGRKLRLIFEDLGENTARIFTGWDI
ncbi:BrnT family toxin [Bdellovibrio sp. HCB209]|uniref:BrnT family toxin n=1 Tax=Bdellovibrio sp. HCB209 TaxID=3394354 RepID=UPI0039B4E678